MSFDNTYKSRVQIPAMEGDVPQELKSSALRKPMASGFSSRSISSQNSSVGAGQTIFFVVPPSNYAIKPHSAYLRFRVNVSGTAAKKWLFQGVSQSSSALFNQLMINLGGQNIELKQNFDILSDLLAIHTGNQNYLNSELAILQGSSALCTVANGWNTNTNYDFCIPLHSETIFSNTKAFPMYLLKENMTIQLNTNALNRAILSAADTGATGYTISNIYLSYDTIDLNEEFVSGVKASMREGQLFQINAVQTISTILGAQGANSIFNIGTNMSSILSVLYTYVANFGGATNTSVISYKNNGVNDSCDFRVLTDGKLVASEIINTIPVQYAHFLKALNTYLDTSSSMGVFDATNYAAEATRTLYTNDVYFGGQSLTRFDPNSASMTGSHSNNLQLQLQVANAPANTDSLIYFINYSVVIVLDADGNCQRLM